jgi:hypothetical protein
MASELRQELLKRIPPITELLKTQAAIRWLKTHPLPLVTDCLRGAAAGVREELLADSAGHLGPEQVTAEAVLPRAAVLLERATTPRLREAINATGHHPTHGPGPGGFPRWRGGFDVGRAERLFHTGRGCGERRAH